MPGRDFMKCVLEPWQRVVNESISLPRSLKPLSARFYKYVAPTALRTAIHRSLYARGLHLSSLLKNRPVRAPGLQISRFPAKSCRPRALTRRALEFFNRLLGKGHSPFRAWICFWGRVSQGVALGCHVMALSAQPEMPGYTQKHWGTRISKWISGRSNVWRALEFFAI